MPKSYHSSSILKKIGIIQNSPLVGDFSANVRSIVQGYRECIDHGAELVVAPAAALCGMEPEDLASRTSFIQQTQRALKTLSQELGTAPLLLGAYTPIRLEDELEFLNDDEPTENISLLVPFLLEQGDVTELDDFAVVDINETRVFVAISSESVTPEEDVDLIIKLGDSPWDTETPDKEDEDNTWDAKEAQAPLISIYPVGTAGVHVYGGGSSVYNAQGKAILQLPYFETSNRVVSLSSRLHAAACPGMGELLRLALERGIRDTVCNNGYSGVCLNLDTPNSALLAVLSVNALGSGNVSGITFGKNSDLAKKLGINYQEIDAEAVVQTALPLLFNEEDKQELSERMKASLLSTYAEKRGLMLLSTLSRTQIMLGNYTIYGESCGYLAPLGNLYEIDLYLLCHQLREKHSEIIPAMPIPAENGQDRIIHELVDNNIAAGQLLHPECNYLFKENDVRLVQRKIIASALKRSQLPLILRVDSLQQQKKYPISHRMND